MDRFTLIAEENDNIKLDSKSEQIKSFEAVKKYYVVPVQPVDSKITWGDTKTDWSNFKYNPNQSYVASTFTLGNSYISYQVIVSNK